MAYAASCLSLRPLRRTYKLVGIHERQQHFRGRAKFVKLSYCLSLLLCLMSFCGCGDDRDSDRDLTALGESCFNDHPQACRRNTFCKLPQGECAMNSIRSGACSEIPEACFELYSPVCGCDGRTHANECFADQAAVSLLHTGGCRS